MLQGVRREKVRDRQSCSVARSSLKQRQRLNGQQGWWDPAWCTCVPKPPEADRGQRRAHLQRFHRPEPEIQALVSKNMDQKEPCAAQLRAVTPLHTQRRLRVAGGLVDPGVAQPSRRRWRRAEAQGMNEIVKLWNGCQKMQR